MNTPKLRAPARTTTAGQAYNAILAAILDGSIPAGAPLPLQGLAADLGMSMMPVREAIRQLEAIGILEVEPHRGARVRAMTEDDLIDTYLTRIVLEGALVRQAAERFDEQAARKARDALDAQQRALRLGDQAAARKAHEDFHFTVYRAAGSNWLFRSIGPTWHNSERYRAASLADAAEVKIRRREHELILRHCVDHQPAEAVNALQAHLLTTVESVNAEAAARLTERLDRTEGAT
ncbi:GntR family transcriptional regulator [Amycolatopsis jejuensis]|uniref:GntR family transcriptional regulator n=1 Tax=Amycolatopsis jejuensis TaxID=330084 RepID=UPI00068A3990|nr:GntR family transcriptional regulator [Amycolatopsis jejuensis]